MKIFIAGPSLELNTELFENAANKLRDAGYEFALGYHTYLDAESEELWAEMTLPVLLDCDGVALLEGYLERGGSSFEAGFACGKGIKCRPLAYWLDRPLTRS